MDLQHGLSSMESPEPSAAAAARSPGDSSTVELELEGHGQIPQSAAEARDAVAELDKWDKESDSDDEGAAAAALRSKYGLPMDQAAGQPANKPSAVTGTKKNTDESPSPASETKNEFSWDDQSSVQELTQKNVHLMAQVKDFERTVRRLEETLIAVKPPPGLEPGKFS
jgi:hypothetical protein